MVFKGSELNISPIISGDNNKGEYISSEQVDKYEGEACINDQAVPDQKNTWLGTERIYNKRRFVFKPEDQMVSEAIK